MASIFTPVVTAAVITPNPANAGGTAQVYITAVDMEAVPTAVDYVSGEFASGEV